MFWFVCLLNFFFRFFVGCMFFPPNLFLFFFFSFFPFSFSDRCRRVVSVSLVFCAVTPLGWLCVDHFLGVASVTPSHPDGRCCSALVQEASLKLKNNEACGPHNITAEHGRLASKKTVLTGGFMFFCLFVVCETVLPYWIGLKVMSYGT